MTLLEQIRLYLKTTLKLSDQEIDSLTQESNLAALSAALIDKDAQRIKELKEGINTTNQQLLTAKWKEGRESLEGVLQTTFGIDKTVIGDALVAAVKEAKGAKPEALTDDAVKSSKLYQDLAKAKAESEKAKEKEFNDYKAAQGEKENVSGLLSNEVWPGLAKDGYVIPADRIGQKRKLDYEKDFFSFKYEKQADGSYLIKDSAGKLVENAQGRAKTIAEHRNDLAADYFVIATNPGGDGNPGGGGASGGNTGGAGGNGGGNNYPAGIVKPKTLDELQNIVNDTKLTANDRRVVLDTWDTEHKEGTGE